MTHGHWVIGKDFCTRAVSSLAFGVCRRRATHLRNVVNDRYRNRQIRYADMHADNRILSDLLQFPHICMSADLHCICRYDLISADNEI